MDNNTLKELREEIYKIRTEDLPAIRVDIATLKVKSSLWGGLSGTLGGALAALALFLTKLLTGG